MKRDRRSEEIFFSGDDRAVILFHAYTGSPLDMRLLALFLHKKGYSVYAPLFKGHGQSDMRTLLSYDAMDWYDDARNAVQWLKDKGYTKIIALGLSMGGIMATRLAADRIVDGAGTFCSPVISSRKSLDRLCHSFLDYAHSMQERQATFSDEPLLSEESLTHLFQEQIRSIGQFSKTMEPDLEHITGPFYIAQAGEDELIDPMVSVELKEKLIGAHVTFHWFEESTHVITIGKDRLAFQESVFEFLENIVWR